MIAYDALSSLAATEEEPRGRLYNYFNRKGPNRERAVWQGQRNTSVGVTFDPNITDLQRSAGNIQKGSCLHQHRPAYGGVREAA